LRVNNNVTLRCTFDREQRDALTTITKLSPLTTSPLPLTPNNNWTLGQSSANTYHWSTPIKHVY